MGSSSSAGREAPRGPVKRSVALVIFRDPARDRLLSVRRPPDDEDLPGAWGLPAGSLREGEGWEEAARRAGREKLGVDLRLRDLRREGEVKRAGYRLRMRLYEAEVVRGQPAVPQAVPDITQYVALAWAKPDRLTEAARRGSLCSRLCLAWLGSAADGSGEGSSSSR